MPSYNYENWFGKKKRNPSFTHRHIQPNLLNVLKHIQHKIKTVLISSTHKSPKDNLHFNYVFLISFLNVSEERSLPPPHPHTHTHTHTHTHHTHTKWTIYKVIGAGPLLVYLDWIDNGSYLVYKSTTVVILSVVSCVCLYTLSCATAFLHFLIGFCKVRTRSCVTLLKRYALLGVDTGI